MYLVLSQRCITLFKKFSLEVAPSHPALVVGDSEELANSWVRVDARQLLCQEVLDVNFRQAGIVRAGRDA